MEEETKEQPKEEKTHEEIKKELVAEKYQELVLDDGQTALVSVLQDLTKAIEGLKLATIMRR